jgi:site-specific recombinase XerD
MNAVEQPRVESPISTEWAVIAAQAPQLADTMGRYLAQAATFLAPASVDSASLALRQLSRWLIAHTEVRSVAGLSRNTIEDYKVWLADQLVPGGRRVSVNTQRQRLRMLRVFFERIIEWDWSESNGTGATRQHVIRSSVATSRPASSRSPSSSMIVTPPS